MVRIVHIADVHLGARCSYLGDKAGEREKDFLYSFERVVRFCCTPENHIDALVIAGDLFDRCDPPGDVVGFVQNHISALNQNNVAVIVVPGTHDAYGYKTSIYRKGLLHGIHMLSSPTLEPFVKEFAGQKVFFYGMVYTPGVNPSFESFTPVQEEGIHIGIVHGVVDAPSHWNKREKDLHMTAEEVACSKLDYLALGHVHNFQENQYGKTVAVYPGSLESKDFSECGHRYMVVVDFAGGTPAIEKIAVNSRMMRLIELNIDMHPLQSLKEIVSLIQREYSYPESLVKLIITGASTIPVDEQYIEQALSDTFFYLTVTDQTSVVESHLVKAWINEKTIRGMFVSKLLQKISEAEGEEKVILEKALKIGVATFQEVV